MGSCCTQVADKPDSRSSRHSNAEEPICHRSTTEAPAFTFGEKKLPPTFSDAYTAISTVFLKNSLPKSTLEEAQEEGPELFHSSDSISW